jgi:hypothetical protein
MAVMADWTASLMERDGSFAQILFLCLLALLAYRAFAAPYPHRRFLAQTAGIFLFVALFIISLVNIILWT